MKLVRSALALLALCTSISAAAHTLEGTWQSIAGDDKALNGTLVISGDGSAILAPDGYTPLEGVWRVEGPTLFLEMPPHGESEMGYDLDEVNDELTLTYNNGSSQTFLRVTDEPSPEESEQAE